MEEKKHVCKHCNKRFQCGKSLGGHIRTHMMNEHYSVNVNNNNNEERNKNNGSNTMLLKRKRDLGSCDNNDGNLIYGLRENPKKTTRFVHSNVVRNNNNNNSQLEKFCRECGKGFPSLKALCGHMACHSEKEKEKDKGRLFENNSGSVITEKQKLVLDSSSNSSQSDTETSVPMKSTRSKRIKFKNLSSGSNNNYHSIPLLNASSSVSEVEDVEKEIIKCLVEMSKDTNFEGTLVTDSSENNSVLLEEKSPSPMNYGIIVEEEEKKKKVKHKDVNFKSKYYNDDYDSDNSDSGYFLFGPKKLDSVDEVNSSKVGYFEYLDNDKRLDSRKRPRENNDSKRAKVVFSNGEKYNGYDDSAYESDENSSESDSFLATEAQNNNNNGGKNVKVKKSKKGKGKKKLKSKKSKEHECPICNKIFKSGQALGGHKRSHFIGGYEENTLLIRPNPTPVRAPPPPPPPPPPCVIDLNLPAPDDE